ncbi:MAG: hypothetical protein K1000chlam4_00202 [Chlamydiae bacterium]|nr:hypothetical protein [Chlamydiota bacterium]
MSPKHKNYETSSSNIFADLGLGEADDLMARAKLLFKVAKLIKASKLTQREVAERLGISQPKVSMLIHGKLSAFSTDTLIRYLSTLGCKVEIRVQKPKTHAAIFRRKGHIGVSP